jgi:hypothetical protein
MELSVELHQTNKNLNQHTMNSNLLLANPDNKGSWQRKGLITALMVLFSFFITANLQAQTGELHGKVVDEKTGELVPFAKLKVSINDTVAAEVTTNLEGKYSIKDLPPGDYKLDVSFVGYEVAESKNISVHADGKTNYDVGVASTTVAMEETEVKEEDTKISHHGKKETTGRTSWGDGSRGRGDTKTRTSEPSTDVTLGSGITTTETYSTTILSDDVSGGSTSDADYFHYESAPKVAKDKSTSSFISEREISRKVDAEESLVRSDLTKKAGSTGTSKSTSYSAGTLTAGEIHDFSKWDLWTDIAASQLAEWQRYWTIKPTQRYSVQLVNKEGWPIVDQEVRLISTDKKAVWTARTDNTGKAELWAEIFPEQPHTEKYTVETTFSGETFTVNNAKQFQEGVNNIKIDTECGASDNVDIMVVVDATGSMGDEINYLKAELNDVITNVKSNNKDLKINLGSVFYRDKTDAYLTHETPLSADISKTVNFINKQYAGGGGDYPEAMDVALKKAVNEMSWRPKARARLLFLVLDAPPHYNETVLNDMKNTIAKAAKNGIRIIPVTGSGIDKRTEYLMRTLSLSTNGTYTFLTNHSGVGGHHIEPTTDSYDVEKLNDLLIRLIGQFTFTPDCQEEQLIEQLVDNPADSLNNNGNNGNGHIGQDGNNGNGNNNGNNNNGNNNMQKDLGMKIYPNPTAGMFKVEVDAEVPELFVTDITGKILMREVKPSVGKAIVFDLTNYSSGVYFVNGMHNKKRVTKKVILVR